MNEEVLRKEGEITSSKKPFSAIVLTVTMFLLPILFIPSFLYPFQVYKSVTLFIGVAIAIVALLIARIKAKESSYPAINTLLIIAIAAPILYFVSGFLTNGVRGMLGIGFDIHSTIIILACFGLLFATIFSFRNNKTTLSAYLAFFASFALVAVFHILRILMGKYVGMLGLPGDFTNNTIGKWNDLSVFLGLGVVLTLFTIEYLALPRLAKIALYTLSVISLILIAINGFISVWIAIGVAALIVFVTSYLNNKKDITYSGEYKPHFSIAVLVIAVIFSVGGTAINAFISEKLNIAYVEARPSVVSTTSIIKESLKTDALFGSGQSGFSNLWLKYKPNEVNQTVFWNTDFLYGFGFIPSLIVTSGLVGTLPILLFLAVFIFFGIKLVRSQATAFSKYIAVSSFTGALYLWLFSIIYIPSIVTIALMFFFTGIAIAAMYQQRILRQTTVAVEESTQAKLTQSIIVALLILVIAGVGYITGKRVLATLYFQESIYEISQNGNVDQALLKMIRAVQLEPTDYHFRALAQLDNAKVQQVISQNQDNKSEEFATQLQNMLAQTVADAQQAVALSPDNYLNYMVLAELYTSLIPVPGAYDNALATYNKAIEVNPKNPGIRLALARLEILNKDTDAARKYINDALQLKSNYTEAIFLLSQIEIEEGNLKQAIKNVESVTAITPNDPTVFFQLGFLKYNDQDYDGAIQSLKRAVTLVPSYSNAKYFLGLSYSKKGMVEEAIAQFNDIKVLNPDNPEIDLILNNLNAGRAPFTNVQAPLDDAPEKRDKLPIDETQE